MNCGATTRGLLHLTSAEATGPEDLRHNATARGLVSGLLKRARPTYAPQAHMLARRIELVSWHPDSRLTRTDSPGMPAPRCLSLSPVARPRELSDNDG